MADLCPPVSGIGPPSPPFGSRFLECETDSVTVCIDQPLAVSGIIGISNAVETKHPGVPGTIIPGSRWSRTGFNSLAGTLTITSPTPAGNQRVVCDWLDYSLVVASVGLGGATMRPQVLDGGGGPVLWQNAIGIVGLVNLGTTYSGDSDGLVLVSSLGTALVFTLPVLLTLFDKSLNFGGYLVQV